MTQVRGTNEYTVTLDSTVLNIDQGLYDGWTRAVNGEGLAQNSDIVRGLLSVYDCS